MLYVTCRRVRSQIESQSRFDIAPGFLVRIQALGMVSHICSTGPAFQGDRHSALWVNTPAQFRRLRSRSTRRVFLLLQFVWALVLALIVLLLLTGLVYKILPFKRVTIFE